MTTHKRKRSVWSVLGGILLGLILLLVLVVVGAYFWAKTTSSAKTSGDIRFAGDLLGPRGPVSITRNQWGIPHIIAKVADEDVIFALGFVHWQDRAWQMDFQRRVAQGRLAEVLGEAALPQDKFLRTWGFERAAQSIVPALSARSQSLIKAYTAGVNAAMKQGKVATEFRILGYTPEPWTDLDSVSWSKLMAYDLGGNMDDEVLGSKVVKKLGQQGLNEIIAPYPKNAPTILTIDELPKSNQQVGSVSTVASLPESTIKALQSHLAAARQLGLEKVPGKGSNDWVISGKRTASGKPILADDPHLALTSPMLWYLADLQGPTLKTIGATIPSLPSVVIGRNEKIAWGVTNVNPDVQDLFIEPATAKLTERTEIIKVKGQPNVNLIVRESTHGPIVSDVGAAAVGPKVALKWTALQPNDTTMDAFLGLNYAQNWQDFKAALAKYIAPSQNFVYADTAGNTGYYAPGKVPIRSGWDGSLPVAGNRDWKGYIPFDQLPYTYNPADGLVVTANNKVVPDGYPYYLGNIRNWAEPYRAERITELLKAKPSGITLDDVKKVQYDTISLVWKDFKDSLLNAQAKDDLSQQVLALLGTWDGNMLTNSPQATIFEAWLMQLQNMGQDELADNSADSRMNSLSVLNQLKSNGELCALNGKGDCAALLSSSLQKVVADLAKRLGNNPRSWEYGKVHVVASNHRAFGKVAGLATIFNHSAPTPGGTNTINVARPEFGTFKQTHGPSYRQIIDLNNMNKSVFIGSLGQNGNPFGPHVADQQAKWIAGEYLPMSTDPKDWGDTKTLTLRPQ